LAIKSDHKRSLFYIYFNWLPLKILYMSEGYGGYMLDIAIQMTAIWGRLQAPEITAEYGVTTTAGGWHGLIPSLWERVRVRSWLTGCSNQAALHR
jgi:hypothetical protein